jgi:hypothetical protein
MLLTIAYKYMCQAGMTLLTEEYKTMTTIYELSTEEGNTTTVALVRETEKAILLKGNCSESWFPKSALKWSGDSCVTVKSWLPWDLAKCFLFHVPYDESKSLR